MEAIEHLSHIKPISIEFPTPSCPIHKRFRFDALSLLVSILVHLTIFGAAIHFARPGGGGVGDGFAGGGGNELGGSGAMLEPVLQGGGRSFSALTVSLVENFESNNLPPDAVKNDAVDNEVLNVVQEVTNKDAKVTDSTQVKDNIFKHSDLQAFSDTSDVKQKEFAITKVAEKRLNQPKDIQHVRLVPEVKQIELKARENLDPQRQSVKDITSAKTGDRPYPSSKEGDKDGGTPTSPGTGEASGQDGGVGAGNGVNNGEAGSGLGYRPILVKSPKPDYPIEARDMGFEGAVALAVMVDNSGEVQEVDVVKSSGRADCDAEAAQTVKNRWKFRPAQRNGAPITATERVEVVFKLYS